MLKSFLRRPSKPSEDYKNMTPLEIGNDLIAEIFELIGLNQTNERALHERIQSIKLEDRLWLELIEKHKRDLQTEYERQLEKYENYPNSCKYKLYEILYGENEFIN